MKELLVRKAECAIVDDEDYERLSKYTWHMFGSNIGRTSYIKGSGRRARLAYTALASEIMNNLDKTYDHIDRNPLNNCKSNLRECTVSQNMANRRKRLGTVSKYRGVVWHIRDKIWMAKITYNKHVYYLGSFTKETDAALAYNNAAIRFFKEFASLNIIEQ